MECEWGGPLVDDLCLTQAGIEDPLDSALEDCLLSLLLLPGADGAMAPGPPTSHKRCRQDLDVGAPPPAQPHLEVVTASSPVMCDGEGFGCIKGTAVGGGYTSEHGHAEHVRRVCTSLPPNCSLCMHDDHQVKKNAERHKATLGNSAMAQGYAAYAELGLSLIHISEPTRPY